MRVVTLVVEQLHALPGAYWITQCDTSGMQTAFKTIDGMPRAESRYVQASVNPCGNASSGVFPFVVHGFAQSDVHALTFHACESGVSRSFAVDGDVPCGVGSSCAVASLLPGAGAACP